MEITSTESVVFYLNTILTVQDKGGAGVEESVAAGLMMTSD